MIETGEPEAAVAERRTAFDVQPTIDNFRSLPATVADTDRDAAHTEAALTVVRERAAEQAGYLPHLIDVLILAGRDDEAWHTGLTRWNEIPTQQRVELVELRRRTHPAEVCEPYQALIDAQLLDPYDKRRYDRAITLLRNLREAYVDTGEVTCFEAYLETLRAEHRRRPTFLAKLDDARFQPSR
ncbi:hypothetical protein AB0C22_26355 [Micromonospora sp. NPDC048894]|uniref:hypothetical protein n=1 Tax=unclassified Micromonospora TaxID=2617518 RepID=UPI0033EDCDE2